MEPATTRRAAQEAKSLAVSLGLEVDNGAVLNDSNRVVVRLLPCDVVARISPIGWFGAAREVEVARRLAAETDAPIAGLDVRVDPVSFRRGGFDISLWTHVEAEPSSSIPPEEYSAVLQHLHEAMRQIDDVAAPHCTERLQEAVHWITDHELTPDLRSEDRELLVQCLEPSKGLLLSGAGSQGQLLHGEPHPWNVLNAERGPVFVDFENCARGPIEYDLGWVPQAVSGRYPGVDPELVEECRGIVLALVAAHRWRRDDQHPSGRQSGIAFLDHVRTGPPWPALDDVSW
jgi:hypothetical protein